MPRLAAMALLVCPAATRSRIWLSRGERLGCMAYRVGTGAAIGGRSHRTAPTPYRDRYRGAVALAVLGARRTSGPGRNRGSRAPSLPPVWPAALSAARTGQIQPAQVRSYGMKRLSVPAILLAMALSAFSPAA